jgi:transcription antitermination factor NusG
LQGCTGILVRQNPKKGKLVVNIDIVKKAVSVELDIEDVESVTAPPPKIVSS